LNAVKSWLLNEASRVEQLPCLEDALFGTGAFRYALYRLRYVLVQAVLRTSFRFLEVALFASVLPFDILSSVLALRSIMLLGEGFWWGALETLRSDVRRLFSQGRLGQASQRAAQWLAFSVVLAIAVSSLGLLWVWFGPSPFQSFSVVDAYVLACCVRWSIDLLASAYHAGVYGVRRVYRPIWSLLLLDIADMATLGLAFWSLGIWGLSAALVVTGVVRALTLWSFTRRVYANLKLYVGTPGWWFQSLLEKSVWSPRHSIEHASSNVIAQVDALFVIGILAAPGETEATLVLAALFHVITPLQSAAGAWSRLFYFDFKRLEAWNSRFLLQRFERFLNRAAWWIPLPIGVVTLALMAALWRGPFWLLAFELTCLAAVRSRLSLVHIRAYSLSDHGFLRRLFLGMVVIAAVTPLLSTLPPEQALGAVVLLMASGLALLGRSRHTLVTRPAQGLLEPSAWLQELLKIGEPVVLGLARVDRRLSTVGRLARALKDVSGPGIQTRLSNDTLVWFSTKSSEPKDIITFGAGTIKELQLGGIAQNGRDALHAGVDGKTWQRHLGALLTSSHKEGTPDLPSLERSLVDVHPAAKVVALTVDSVANFEPLMARALRRLLLDAARGRTEFQILGNVHVAILAPAGEPLAMVLVPRDPIPPHDWKSPVTTLVRRANLLWTLRAGLN
jgi:hypothetical protein